MTALLSHQLSPDINDFFTGETFQRNARNVRFYARFTQATQRPNWD